ncbi:hypothetical protein, partial [Ralstonia mannitolilytica]|uniref:hypothetical protein n=1 Tax=Ralstonia mannitolilytica TaxID=105219 RepID=UPI00292DCF80
EITAQTPGLSAEEMERYYTVPMEIGLAATPGVENIRSLLTVAWSCLSDGRGPITLRAST